MLDQQSNLADVLAAPSCGRSKIQTFSRSVLPPQVVFAEVGEPLVVRDYQSPCRSLVELVRSLL